MVNRRPACGQQGGSLGGAAERHKQWATGREGPTWITAQDRTLAKPKTLAGQPPLARAVERQHLTNTARMRPRLGLVATLNLTLAAQQPLARDCVVHVGQHRADARRVGAGLLEHGGHARTDLRLHLLWQARVDLHQQVLVNGVAVCKNVAVMRMHLHLQVRVNAFNQITGGYKQLQKRTTSEKLV